MSGAGLRALDDFLPAFEFTERHRIAIAAPPERIDEALRRCWRVIRPFSGLIRILFLRAARKRAEAAA